MSYGSAPANYNVPGEAGGLARIDKILGLNLYSSSFGASPLVFGAFPSLHSGSATIEMAFVVYLWPKAWPLAVAYTMWMWWSTMYLTHHYLIDLVGGSIYAFSAYFVARRHLPPVRADCRTRLDYLGIQDLSWRAFVRSIEFRLNYRKNNDVDHAATAVVDYSLARDHQQDVYVLMEPQVVVQEDKLSLRLRRFDYDDEEESNIGLSYSGSSSPAEPASPITPRSPVSFSHFPPLHLKAQS